MKNWYRKYPPYEGDEPYLYFAFAEGDIHRVSKIMRTLLERGCRIWYCIGRAGNSQELLRRQKRAGKAALTVLYLSDAACADSDTKNNVLVNQESGRSLICLDPDGTDRRLRMGLHESVPHVSLYDLRSDADIESAIIHAEGFSQEIIGEQVKIGGGVAVRLSVLFCLLALILAVVSFFGYYFFSRTPSETTDEVHLIDPVITAAVRDAAAGGVITEDVLSQITFLRLDRAPESWNDLSLLPSLERIELPQQALVEGAALPEGNYIIELRGGMK